ncbi:MAG: hypothetical protein JWR85_4174 [Marmoricola sp.]|nr:hypothetical protein [Marmoricola sp.]
MIDLRPILIAPDSAASDIISNVGTAVSPFTGGMQQTELPGARWKLSFGYSGLNSAQGRVLKAIKSMLRGGAQIANIYDLSYLPRRLVEPGAPVINGSAQSGILLSTTGWTPSIPVLEIGDQISYLSTDGFYRMHMVTGSVASNAAGVAVIPILPPIRNPPVQSTPVSSVKPTISCMWQDGGEVSVDGMMHGTSFVFVEALYAIL